MDTKTRKVTREQREFLKEIRKEARDERIEREKDLVEFHSEDGLQEDFDNNGF